VTAVRVATVLVAAWAAAFWLAEGLLQAVADVSLVASAVLVLRERRSPSEARLPGAARVALAGWQAVSPLIARALWAPGLPPAALWLHCLDTAALAAAAALGAQVVRWTWPAALFLAGGLLSFALSAVQHLVRWSIPVPAVLACPSTGSTRRSAGGSLRRGGFFFHRCGWRTARVAALGPAVATALRPAPARIRALAAAPRGRLRRLHRPFLRPGGAPHALLLVALAGVVVTRSARVRTAVGRWCWCSAWRRC
jgi:hypothetical protein